MTTLPVHFGVQVPSGGWSQIVAFAGYYELFVYKYTGTPGGYSADQTWQWETGKRGSMFSLDGRNCTGNM